MVTTRRRFLAAFAVAGSLLLAYWQLVPSDETRVRRVLDHLARAASIPARPTPAGMILALDRLSGCLSRDVTVVVDLPGEGRRTFTGRSELLEAAKAAWANRQSAKVEFLDLDVKLDPAKENATAELTARVSQAGERDFFVQEFRLQLRKQDDQWRIHRAELVRVLR